MAIASEMQENKPKTAQDSSFLYEYDDSEDEFKSMIDWTSGLNPIFDPFQDYKLLATPSSSQGPPPTIMIPVKL